ncbi:MAG TPA: sulfotransferase [Mycobacteriales bacterium]|nr:sulfotransferase [Mycobacteriales bacterium]
MTAADPALPDAPFFILGAHGSGSTLLRLMLDSHERLAVPQETGVMRLVTAHSWVPFWEFGGEWAERLELTPAELDRRLGEFYGALFSRYAARRGKQRWGDKTPFHVWHVDEIRRVFPSAVFVVIVRHPLGSIASAVRRFDRRLQKATGHWLDTTRELVRQAQQLDAGQMCFVRYEDLIRDPEPTMRELLAWLGEPWSETVLAHHEVQRAQDAPKVVEGGTRPTEAVDASRVERWRDWLGEEDRRYVEEQALPWARLLGYDPDPSVAPQRLTPSDRDRLFVTTAAELSERRKRFTDLDPTPPERPGADDPILPRGRRRRRIALRRAGSARSEMARELLSRLPPSLQRSVREVRRAHRRRQQG